MIRWKKRRMKCKQQLALRYLKFKPPLKGRFRACRNTTHKWMNFWIIQTYLTNKSLLTLLHRSNMIYLKWILKLKHLHPRLEVWEVSSIQQRRISLLLKRIWGKRKKILLQLKRLPKLLKLQQTLHRVLLKRLKKQLIAQPQLPLNIK